MARIEHASARVTAGFDRALGWLMRPRIRLVRRWTFVVTVPVAVAVGQIWGVEHGVLVLVLRFGLWALVAAVVWRIGGERGEAVRDLLMHPRVRALARAEADVLPALPRLAVAAASRARVPGASYHRGTFGLALAAGLTPVIAAEGAVFHLLLDGSWAAWVFTAVHAYALVWLWGYALGPHAFPHRIGGRSAVLRAGALYRARIPLAAVAGATARTVRLAGDGGLVERDGAVLLPARGRVDVWLDLAEPVAVQRPLGDAVFTRRLAIASDAPEDLVERLLARAGEDERDRDDACVRGGLRLGIELLGVARDATQPS